MSQITQLSVTATPTGWHQVGNSPYTNIYLAAHLDQGWGSIPWGSQPWHNYNWFDLANPVGTFFETDTNAELWNQNLRQIFSDADAVLYLPFNGTGGQVTLKDHSEQAHTLTPAVSFQLSSTKTKFNFVTSGRFSASGDKLTIADHANWNFGSGNFTMDFWFLYDAGMLTATTFYSQQVDASNFTQIALSGSTLQFTIKDTAVNEIALSGAVTVTLDTWHHVAVTRSGNDWRLFFNGVLVDSITKSYTAPDLAASIDITGYNATITNTYLADFRILKGRAAWTGAFTPPINAHGSAYIHQWQIAFADVAACGPQGALSATTVFEVDAAGQLVIAVGNVPFGLYATLLVGGAFRLSWLYNAKQQPATPTGFKIYRKLAGAYVLLGTRKYVPGRGRYFWNGGTFAHGTELEVLVRTYRTVNNIDHEENNENIATMTVDAQGPPAIETITATA